jgi:hypothetical protein
LDAIIRSALQRCQGEAGVVLLDAGSMARGDAGGASGPDRRRGADVTRKFDMFDNYEHRAQVFCEAISFADQQFAT